MPTSTFTNQTEYKWTLRANFGLKKPHANRKEIFNNTLTICSVNVDIQQIDKIKAEIS